MISKEEIESIVKLLIEGTEAFLVDVDVKPGNLIRVYIDEPMGISLEECVRVSRAIESSLDRDAEDFDLQVSSPGLDNPLLVLPQYKKNIGRELKIETSSGTRLTGELISVGDKGIKLNAKVRLKPKGAKKSITDFQMVELRYDEIKIAKVNLQFNG